MRKLLTIIAMLAALAAPTLADQKHECRDHNHNHRHEIRVSRNGDVARAAMFRAVCARGDLNQAFTSRKAAAAAAANHRRQTGHPATVRKQ